MSARITGEQAEYAVKFCGCRDCGQMAKRLREQVDADASLATRLAEAETMLKLRERQLNDIRAVAVESDEAERETQAELARLREKLAEAERERDAAKTNADAVWAMAVSGSGGVRCTWCGLVDLSEVQGREHTKSCPQNPMVAELARLRQLAAEAEAVAKILSHPARSPMAGNPLVCLYDSGRPDWAIWARDRDLRIHAPTAVALLERLDALVKPEPEDWRWVWPDGSVSIESRPAAVSWMATKADRGLSGRPMRRTVDPVTGVVTLSPAPAPDTRNEGDV